MARCGGKDYPGCSSCINKEMDPFQCEECVDESKWEGNEDSDTVDDTVEELSVADLRGLCGGFE
jgi:hypothetical protein